MSFAWPYLLWLIAVPTILLAWDLAHQRQQAANNRPKILRAEASTNSIRLSPKNDTLANRQNRPRFWLCLGLTLAIFALARPQWGRIEEPVFDQSREILLAIDLSRSMLTPDIKPSRLERAKLLIQSLLEKLAGERVGLIVFSGTAFLQSPLSADYEILREFLPALGPDFLPEGGTNYGSLLETALQAFGTSSSADRFMIILSDGEATDEDWRTKMEDLKKKNIRVIGLGVGTAAGAMIPDGTGQFVKDERGAVVLSKLESATLQELARATGGVYRDASAWVDLAALLKETIETGRKGEFMEKNTLRLVERFQWPLALAVWCLFVSFCFEFPVRPRPRAIRLGPLLPPVLPTPRKTSALALLLLLGLAFGQSPATAANTKNAAPTPTGAPAEPPTLTKIVGRLSSQATRTARDWAELSRETVAWGSQLQTEKQPIADGPIRDALQAVELGAKLDAKSADWPKLREELEALLKKPDEDKEKPDQSKDSPDKEDQPQSDQDKEQDKDSKKPDQKSDKKKSDKSDQKKSSPQDQKDESTPPEESPQPDNKSPEAKPPGESAFGDMNKKEEPPPPPPGDTQKVGGSPEKPEQPLTPPDPALALPTQKLDQLRNQDSPAQLFQLMEGERKPAKKNGKDW